MAALIPLRCVLFGVIVCGASVPAQAASFSRGALKGSFDSTLSIGGIYRLDNPDPGFYGVANGGRQNSVNADDGNLNYRQGWASWVAKGTHDLELEYGEHLGAFARVTYFYDFVNEREDRARVALSPRKPMTAWAGASTTSILRYSARENCRPPGRSPGWPAGAEPRGEHVHPERDQCRQSGGCIETAHARRGTA